jgi:hypothetical protein
MEMHKGNKNGFCNVVLFESDFLGGAFLIKLMFGVMS